ncbi:MAG: hypothetical protein ACNA8W_22040 [Bradymonadaceae bacterium]
MNRNLFVTLLTLLTLLTITVIAPPVLAGPWTKDKGEFYAKVGEGTYLASAFRNADGETVEGSEYLSMTTFAYGEVGLLDGLHVQGYIPLLYARNRVERGTYTDFGLGDASLGIQASPLKLAIPTSIRLDAKIPLYGAPPVGPGAQFVPARGDGQIDLTTWLSTGAGTATYYFYADIGYQHRTTWSFDPGVVGPFSDGFVFQAQVGYSLFGQAILAIGTGGVLPLEQDTTSKGYVTVGPSLFYPVSDTIALEAAGYGTPWSRNSAAGWAANVGISFRGRVSD